MQLAFKRLAFNCSSLKVPIIDVSNFLSGKPGYESDCKQVSEVLHKFGCLVIKDPRVQQEHNNVFLDQMEKYFSKRGEDFYQGDTTSDIYPNYSYQVGATPEGA